MPRAARVRYGEKHEGCWFDGSRGKYIGCCVINLALQHGWQGCDITLPETDPFGENETWAAYEHYHELWDSAEEFMQQFAKRGFHFRSHPDWGDWGLYRG